MTDNEIIKVLEFCPEHNCDVECPLFNTPYCVNVLMQNALDLIKRQHERIERLKDNLDAVLKERADHTEAVREFAERLNEKAFHDMNDGEAIVYCCDIDNLVKEMVGDNNG